MQMTIGKLIVTIGKWFIEFWTDKGYIVALNIEPTRKLSESGLTRDWYDGPHNAFVIGPFNIYWNW